MKWFVYIARDKDVFLVGTCNDIAAEDTLLNFETNWTTEYKIVWFLECENKIQCLEKYKNISTLTQEELVSLTLNQQKIIIITQSHDIDVEKYPLIVNLKNTLDIINFMQVLPELWKLNEQYLESVAEFLSVKRGRVESLKLWDISIDYSNNVGLITSEKFYPIIKY